MDENYDDPGFFSGVSSNLICSEHRLSFGIDANSRIFPSNAQRRKREKTGANTIPISDTNRWGNRHHAWTPSQEKNDSASRLSDSDLNSHTNTIDDRSFLLKDKRDPTIERVEQVASGAQGD